MDREPIKLKIPITLSLRGPSVVGIYFIGGSMEEWKDVEGVVGRYEISNMGRIKSLNKANPIIMRQSITHKGYMRVCLGAGCLTQSRAVHRLVAIAFCNGYSPSLEVNHIDGNKRNNYYKNLEWVTRKQNRDHGMAMGLYRKGNTHPMRKLTEEKVLNIRAIKKSTNKSYIQIAKDFNMDPWTIRHICLNILWKHI